MEDTLKFKSPIDDMLNGEYTIEIFDKNKKLVDKTTAHNCINKGLYSTAYYNFIYNGLINNDCTKNSMYCKNSNSSLNGLVNWLILINEPESLKNDYNNSVILGEVIGYSHTSDTNSYPNDKKRGIPNIAESRYTTDWQGIFLKSGKKTYAYDFSNDVANGTFDNLYMTSLGLSSSNENNPPTKNFSDYNVDSNYKLESKTKLADKVSGDSGLMSNDENYLYIQSMFLASNTNSHPTASYDMISCVDLSSGKVKYVTLQVPADNIDNHAFIIQGGGYFWRIESTYRTTRYKLDGTYVDSINLYNYFNATNYFYLGASSSSLSLSTSYGYNPVYYNAITGDDKYIYVGYVDSTNISTDSSTKLYKLHMLIMDSELKVMSDTVINEISNVNTGNQRFAFNMFYVNNKKYILYSNINYELNSSLFQISDDGIPIKVPYESFHFLTDYLTRNIIATAFLDKKGMLYTQYSDSTFYSKKLSIGRLIPWTSHVKLDKPITKTKDNTMKITYTINAEFKYSNDGNWE